MLSPKLGWGHSSLYNSQAVIPRWVRSTCSIRPYVPVLLAVIRQFAQRLLYVGMGPGSHPPERKKKLPLWLQSRTFRWGEVPRQAQAGTLPNSASGGDCRWRFCSRSGSGYWVDKILHSRFTENTLSAHGRPKP